MTIAIVAEGFANGTPCPHAGQYLKSFDFNYGDGQGFGVFTSDERMAMTFADHHEAFVYWETASTTRPLRPDGQPNRPLTSLTISTKLIADIDQPHGVTNFDPNEPRKL